MKSTLILLIFLLLPGQLFGNQVPFFITTPVTAINEDVFYHYLIIAGDSDIDDTLTYFIEDKPDWLGFIDYSNDTALLFGAPTQYYDQNHVIISVTDGKDTVSQEFNITYLYEIYAMDVTSEVVLNIDSVPDWLTFESDNFNHATLSGTPSIMDTGRYEIIVTAERYHSVCPSSSFQQFHINVRTPIVYERFDSRANSGIQIIPNPFNESITIIQNNNDIINSIELISSQGRQVYRTSNIPWDTAIELDTSSLSPGLYYIRMYRSGELIAYKLVKIKAH
jgi:hypothetical protein